MAVLEAVRWAASSNNVQLWAFLVVQKKDAVAHDAMLACLMDRNKSWPALAPVLILTFVEPIWTEQDRDNATAVHDVRVASAMMPIQAEALGFRTHHIAGIHHDVIRATYVVP